MERCRSTWKRKREKQTVNHLTKLMFISVFYWCNLQHSNVVSDIDISIIIMQYSMGQTAKTTFSHLKRILEVAPVTQDTHKYKRRIGLISESILIQLPRVMPSASWYYDGEYNIFYSPSNNMIVFLCHVCTKCETGSQQVIWSKLQQTTSTVHIHYTELASCLQLDILYIGIYRWRNKGTHCKLNSGYVWGNTFLCHQTEFKQSLRECCFSEKATIHTVLGLFSILLSPLSK